MSEIDPLDLKKEVIKRENLEAQTKRSRQSTSGRLSNVTSGIKDPGITKQSDVASRLFKKIKTE